MQTGSKRFRVSRNETRRKKLKEMSDYLPPEILTDIFARLPIKTLLRCTSVCKSWYSFITSPSFINSHMNLSIANDESRLLVRICTEDANDFRSFSSTTTKREHFSVRCDNETFDECAKLDFPLTSNNGYFRIIGSFNGLVCLSDDLGGYMDAIILWKPSSKKTVKLPTPSVTFDSHGPYQHVIGFGFVPATNEYKVVRVVYLQRHDGHGRALLGVEIYELSTGSWRNVNVGDFSSLIKERVPQAFLNGMVHWIGYDLNEVDCTLTLSIVTFDMKNEMFGAVMVPSSLLDELFALVATFGESLSLIHQKDNTCSVWVMKEYGVKDSWTKLFTVDQGSDSFRRSFCFRPNGDVLIVRHFGNSISDAGDLSSNDPTSLGIYGKGYFFHVGTYMESLVLIKSLNEVLGRLQNRGDVVTSKGASLLP